MAAMGPWRPWGAIVLDETGWTATAGRERLDAVCAALMALPEQDRPRPDPVYRLVALRKGR
jgi:hypothetical protein